MDTWRKSTLCHMGDCVEVAIDTDAVRIRDSRAPSGPVLAFTPDEWRAFVGGVRRGEFDV